MRYLFIKSIFKILKSTMIYIDIYGAERHAEKRSYVVKATKYHS